MQIIDDLNNATMQGLQRLMIAGQHVGYVRADLAAALLEKSAGFIERVDADTLAVSGRFKQPDDITARFAQLHHDLAATGILPKPAAEASDVRPRMTDAPLCQINRNLIFPLGIVSRGVHCVMRYDNGDLLLAQRSNKVFTFQGCYDVPVGGLLPAGKDPWDHVKTEAAEEAGIAARQLRPTGPARVLAYARNVQGVMQDDVYKPAFPFETDGGTNWDEVFYWTVTLPADARPAPKDGEVKSFLRMTPEAVVTSMRNEPQRWKTNSGVMILQALSLDPRCAALFSAEERDRLKALTIPDPRPVDQRGELASSRAAYAPKPRRP